MRGFAIRVESAFPSGSYFDLSLNIHLNPALRLHQRLLGNPRPTVRAPRGFTHHELVGAMLAENVGEKPVEEQFRLVTATAFASGNALLGFAYGFSVNGNQRNA